MKKIIAAVLAGLLVTGFAFAKDIKVKVGVCGSKNDTWKAVQYVLDQQKAGIKLEIVEFSAYNLPNEALNNKDIDINSFQHIAYLNNDIKNNGYKITPIGETVISPLTLYSYKYKTLAALKNGVGKNGTATAKKGAFKIAIPSDGTNLSRGIKLLEAAGLIEVRKEAGYSPELRDITKFIYNIEVVPQAANTLVRLLDDYGAATINGTYAISAGFLPSKDGLYIEEKGNNGDNPYVNVIVARTEDKDNPVYKKIVEAYQSQLVTEYYLTKNKEASFPVYPYKPFTQEEGEKVVKFIDKNVKW